MPGQATQSHIKATPKRVDRQPIATRKPPQSLPNATPMLPQSLGKAWCGLAPFLLFRPMLPRPRGCRTPARFFILPSAFFLHLQPHGGPLAGPVGVVGAGIGEDDLLGFPVFEECEVGQVEPAAVLGSEERR